MMNAQSNLRPPRRAAASNTLKKIVRQLWFFFFSKEGFNWKGYYYYYKYSTECRTERLIRGLRQKYRDFSLNFTAPPNFTTPSKMLSHDRPNTESDTPRRHRVLVLRNDASLKHSEINERTGVPKATIQQILKFRKPWHDQNQQSGWQEKFKWWKKRFSSETSWGPRNWCLRKYISSTN